MTQATRYREIEVSGTPRALGRQIGEAAREEIRGFCDVALDRVNKTVPISRAAALKVASASIPYAADYSPDMLDELQGTAEAAGVSLEDLMLLQVRNQLQPEREAGCTSLSCAGAATVRGGRIVAQNWDNDPALDEFTVVLTRRPAGKPAFISITQAGLIAYMGVNEAGVGLCLNTLPAPSRGVGVPHYFIVRGIYESDSLEGAVAAVERARRAIPANIMLTTPQGPADLEITIDGVCVLRDEAGRLVTHTNHCLHQDLLPINGEFPELIQSYARKQRIDELTSDEPLSVERVQALLRDHQGHPRSICRHPNDDPGTGFWQTVFSVVIEADAGVMHIARGTPCNRPYETYSLTETA